MPWTRRKKIGTCLVLSLAAVAAMIGLAAFLIHDSYTGWRCPPRQVSSLAEIPNVGKSLSTWQTVGPAYYRYRPVFGQGYFVAVTGVTSPEAIAAFRAGGQDSPDWSGTHAQRITRTIKALSSVPGFAFRKSEDNLSFFWEGGHIYVAASFDPRSRWFVAEIASGVGSGMH